MFDRITSKIKYASFMVLISEIIGSVFCGVSLICKSFSSCYQSIYIGFGIVVILVGMAIAFASFCILCAIGEILVIIQNKHST